ncbi:hypothetical protein [Spongiimicrobium salis]|uniref:hypothetical protein n=1 Tax=Spongiimicrobium salis TaxID=1667022 RepID=UPI00374DE7CE
MENDFLQQPTILIAALVISIIVFVVTIGIVLSLFKAKDTFADMQNDNKGLKKKENTGFSINR